MFEDKDLLSIQEVRSKIEKAYAAWQKYRYQTNARIRQNYGAAAAVQLKLMADSTTRLVASIHVKKQSST